MAVQLYEGLVEAIKPGRKPLHVVDEVYNYAFISPRYFALDARNIHFKKEPYPIFPVFQNQLFPLLKVSTSQNNYHTFMHEIYLTLDLNEECDAYDHETFITLIEVCSELPNLQSFVLKNSFEHAETMIFDAKFHEKSFPKLKHLSFSDSKFHFHSSFFDEYLKNTSYLEVLFLKGLFPPPPPLSRSF